MAQIRLGSEKGCFALFPTEAEVCIIRVAELPSVTFTVYKNGEEIESKSTGANGGVVEFSISELGNYSITASGENITEWNKEFTVSEFNSIMNVKGAILNNYTFEQIHTACQGAYAHLMFVAGDVKKYELSGSPYNNHNFILADFKTINNKDAIVWLDSSYLTDFSFYLENRVMIGSSANSFSYVDSHYGGYKYSYGRQTYMMKQGEEVYSQITGLLPNDYSGSSTIGTRLDDLKYSDTQELCKVYTYDITNDTFEETDNIDYSSTAQFNTNPKFIKGYFVSVGTLTQEQFNDGYYYVKTREYQTMMYTPADSYSSSTEYFGLFDKIHTDGLAFTGLDLVLPYLVKTDYYVKNASTGIIVSVNDYITLPCVEEIKGINVRKVLTNGSQPSAINAYNDAGEGTKLTGLNFANSSFGSEYYTRSLVTHNNVGVMFITNVGAINTSVLGIVRPFNIMFTTN